jgi:hypothetical protein
MVPFSQVCRVCKTILDSPPDFHHYYWKPHHETLDGLQKAFLQRCYFCVTMWKDCDVGCRDTWQDDVASWCPMERYFFREHDSKHELLSLAFSYQIEEKVSYTRFQLTPHDGMYAILHTRLANKFDLLWSDDEVPPKFSNPYMEHCTSSSLTLERIRDWYLTCCATHTKCNRFVQQDTWSPTRLIDIGLHDESEWKLVLPPASGCPRPLYITLSYRWGSEEDFKLTEENLQSGFHGHIKDLPQTFRDAVLVARLLSVQFLWIDRLCIVQNSKTDWDRESVEMRRVYANSSCNIAASASTSPKGGLFRTRNPQDTRP